MNPRASALLFVSLLASTARAQVLSAQYLGVDRQPAAASIKSPAGFLGDHFKLGAPGEVWVIDAIRTWAAVGGTPAANLSDVYEKVILFGGIEAQPPQPGQPPEPECDCHNLMAIQTMPLRAVAAQKSSSQLDFKGIRWSVPGGQQLQFGIMGIPRPLRPGAKAPVWQIQTAADDGGHLLKLFDAKGKLLGPYEGAERNAAIAVQVWAHLSAALAIRSLTANIEIALHGSAAFDVNQTDLESLRFGPKRAAPTSTKVVGAIGEQDLILRFRAVDAGIQPADLTACLAGRLKNGVPFEACDGLSAARGK